MKPRAWGFAGWTTALSGLVAASLLGAIWHFGGRLEEVRTELQEAKKDYETMKRYRVQYRDLEGKKQRIPASDTKVDPSSYGSFLSAKATEAGLPQGPITASPPVSGSGWKELPYTFSLGGRPDQPISRSAFVKFLELVETRAPGFKSKGLTLRFAGEARRNDLSDVSVTFSHFERSGPR